MPGYKFFQLKIQMYLYALLVSVEGGRLKNKNIEIRSQNTRH